MKPDLLTRIQAARALTHDAASVPLADAFTEAVACVQQALAEAEDMAEAALVALAQRVDQIHTLQHQVATLSQERDTLLDLINSPHNAEFLEGVRREIAHQVHRWGTVHDRAKAPADWLWLLGYLAGKALHAHAAGDTEKALHHCISSAAVLANWHTHILLGSGAMAPGSSDLQRFLTETFGAVVPQ